MHDQLGDQVTIIGVAGRDSLEAAQDFVGRTGVGAITHVIDPELEIWREYGIPDQPAWAFINDDGTVQVVVGQLGEETLTEQVELLIDA